MNLQQAKLTKPEWESIEKPIESSQKRLVKMIVDGWNNIDIKLYNVKALIELSKLSVCEENHIYLYNKYFKSLCNNYEVTNKKIKKPKKSDIIRSQDLQIKDCYEIYLIKLISDIEKNKHIAYNYWTLHKLLEYNIPNLNIIIKEYSLHILKNVKVTHEDIYKHSKKIFKTNKLIYKLKPISLYNYQQELFKLLQEKNKYLILLNSPTGTGKTITPIGLSEKYKVIFVCGVRHVSLALAQTAISLGKKIALGFGCNKFDDIRLHYNAAKEFKTDRKSGRIKKVDNLVGNNVEIMICDLNSYIICQDYMLSFNDNDKIITYWDEPTVTLDYKEHPLHEIINNIWIKNKISTMILSSATLPNNTEIKPVLDSYKNKFPNGIIKRLSNPIVEQNIKLLDKDNNIISIHNIYRDQEIRKDVISHIKKNKILLKYLDLEVICDFLRKNNHYPTCKVEDLTSNIIKMNYLNYLESTINETNQNIQIKNVKLYESSILLTTNDATTLTEGPTIYIAEDIEKISKFCLKKANIPKEILDTLNNNLQYNNKLIEKINILQKEHDDMQEDKSTNNQKKNLESTLIKLSKQYRKITLEDCYIPNKKDHQIKYHKTVHESAYQSNISDEDADIILNKNEISNQLKILLLMGIGVFLNDTPLSYKELIKQLTYDKKLYLIIASSDYIYGTNYQFCHGYIGKDLNDITQEKMIQALGRIGRNNIGNIYTIRLRDNLFIDKLFLPDKICQEAIMMCKLFNSLST